MVDRFYKGALGLAPIKCDCGRKLSKPIHGELPTNKRYDGWHIVCACHAVFVWSFPNVWRKQHTLPLFNRNQELSDNYQPKE